MLVSVTLLVAALGSIPPTYDTGAAQHATALRDALIGDDSGYDTNVPPPAKSIRTLDLPDGSTVQSATGTDVELQIRVLKIVNVNVAEGSLSLKVWFRMKWVDSRLEWDPAAYGGLEYTFFNGGMPEDWELWLPDIQPYNAQMGTMHTLDPAMAQVRHDGTVFFSRPGTIDVLCKFSGLVAFPFDSPTCSFDIGGYMWSGFHQGITLAEGKGFLLDVYGGSGSERVKGFSYQEYTLAEMTSTITTYTYDSIIGTAEPFPVATFTMKLNRATTWYQFYILFPSVLITLLSFTVFWADSSSADALGFGVTVIVVVMLMQVVLIGALPICGELLWIDLFYLVNTSFACFSLFQSALIIAIESNEGEHLVPRWMADGARTGVAKVSALLPSMTKSKVGPAAEEGNVTPRLNSGGKVQIGAQSANLRSLAASPNVAESIAGILYRRMKSSSGHGKKGKLLEQVEQGEATAPQESIMERLIFFERMFLELDEDRSGVIDGDAIFTFLSFTALAMDPNDRDDAFSAADIAKDGQLTRLEFCMLCRDHLWEVPMSQLQLAMTNLKDLWAAKGLRNKLYWSEVAKSLEKWARMTIIPLYILVLALIFQIDFTDEYGIDGSAATMQEGLAEGVWRGSTGQAIGVLLIPVLLMILLWFVHFLTKRLDAKQAEKEKEMEDRNVRELLNTATQADSDEQMVSRRYAGAKARTEPQDLSKPSGLEAVVPCIAFGFVEAFSRMTHTAPGESWFYGPAGMSAQATRAIIVVAVFMHIGDTILPKVLMGLWAIAELCRYPVALYPRAVPLHKLKSCVQVVTFPAISIVEAVAAVTVLRMLPIPEMVYPPPAETVAQLLIAATLPANLLALNYVGPLASKARQSLELTEEDVERMLEPPPSKDDSKPSGRKKGKERAASRAKDKAKDQ